MPLMLVEHGCAIMPYIGERLHAHTSYKGSTADAAQDIIVAMYSRDGKFYFTTTGTTQRYLYDSGNNETDLGFSLVPYGEFYDFCWRQYNTLLLNHLVRAKGRVRYKISEILNMDMCKMKLCQGQRLLPVTASAVMGSRLKLAEAEFILVKEFTDGIVDSAILPTNSSGYVWVETNNEEDIAERLWIAMGGGAGFSDIYIQDSNWNVDEHRLEYGSYSVTYIGDNLQPGTAHAGDVKTLHRYGMFTIHFREVIEFIEIEGHADPPVSMDSSRYFDSAEDVTFTFTAVPE